MIFEEWLLSTHNMTLEEYEYLGAEEFCKIADEYDLYRDSLIDKGGK